MNAGSVFPFRLIQALLIAASVSMSAPAAAGDPSAAIRSIGEAPPEAQIEIVRIILNDLFGSPEEVRAKFAAACNQRKTPTKRATEKKAAEPLSSRLQARVAGASKEASLLALCAGPVRTKIEAALVRESVIAKRHAAEEEASSASVK